MEFKATPRGFFKGTFEDRNGLNCSLQESSAMDEEGLIWFGVHNPELKVLIPYKGWKDIDLREHYPIGDILTSSRMHLSQSQVQALLPSLIYFVTNGTLPDESDDEIKNEMNDLRELVSVLRNSEPD